MCVEKDVPPTAACEDDEDSDLEEHDEREDDLETESAAADSHKSESLGSFSEVRSYRLPRSLPQAEYWTSAKISSILGDLETDIMDCSPAPRATVGENMAPTIIMHDTAATTCAITSLRTASRSYLRISLAGGKPSCIICTRGRWTLPRSNPGACSSERQPKQRTRAALRCARQSQCTPSQTE